MLLELTFNNANGAFEHFQQQIIQRGEYFANTKALFNQSFTLTNPVDNAISNPDRKWNYNYAEREWKWYKSGDRSVEELKKFAPIWEKMHDGDNLVWSNYGWWWKLGHQLESMIEMLKKNYESRRAVIVHYDPTLVGNFSHDTPCNLVLNFFIVDGKLHLTIFARSIDLWYGFCNDQFCFSKLMIEVAAKLNRPVGLMHWFITNLHLYNDKL